MSSAAFTSPPVNSGRWQALVILLLPVIVISLSTAVYFLDIGHPQTQVQKGYLLEPALPLNALFGGNQLPEELASDHQWQLLLSIPAGCQQSCQYWRHQLQQIQTALGKNQRRVRTALLSEQTSPEFTEPGIPWLQLQQPVAPDAELAQQIKADTGQPIIWIVDPQNNLVMHYSADQLPKEILTDLKRLLKLSLIG